MFSILLSRRFLLPALIAATVYFVVAGLAMNFGLLQYTWLHDYPLSYKLSLTGALLQGLFQTVDPWNVVIMVLIALLTGANLGLLIFSWNRRWFSQAAWGSGFGSMVGALAAGCFHCGLPILSIFGLLGSLAFLPWHGLELSIMAVVILSGTLIFSLYQLTRPTACPV